MHNPGGLRNQGHDEQRAVDLQPEKWRLLFAKQRDAIFNAMQNVLFPP